MRLALAAAVIFLAGCGSAGKQTTLSRNDTTAVSNPQEQPPGGFAPKAPDARAPAPPSSGSPGRHGRQTRGGWPKPASLAIPERPGREDGLALPSGSVVRVALDAGLSSASARAGERWVGRVRAPVRESGRVLVPAGSEARGVVSRAIPARRGSRAQLRLTLVSLTVRGRAYAVRGSSREFVAGSPRARNVGGIAAGTAAGALIGRAIGGSGHGALVGALLGGGASGVAVARSKGYQVRLEPGAPVDFVIHGAVTASRRARGLRHGA